MKEFPDLPSDFYRRHFDGGITGLKSGTQE
jgi:hypothetical protein